MTLLLVPFIITKQSFLMTDASTAWQDTVALCKPARRSVCPLLVFGGRQAREMQFMQAAPNTTPLELQVIPATSPINACKNIVSRQEQVHCRRWCGLSGTAMWRTGSAAGNSTRSSISEPRQASSEFSAAGSSSLHPRALFSSKPPPPSQQPASTGTSPAQSRRPPRSVRPPAPPSQDATIFLRRLSERLTAIRTDAEQQGAARGSQTAQLSAVTEESYKAGLACLESHDLKLADKLLSLALNACPADRVRAQEKIKALLEKCRQPASG